MASLRENMIAARQRNLLRKGAIYDLTSQTRARRHAGPQSFAAYPGLVRTTSFSVRAVFRRIS